MSTIANDELAIKINVDDRSAEDKLKGINKELDRTVDAADRASDGFSKTQARLVTLNSVVQLTKEAFNLLSIGVQATFKAVDALADRGERVGSLADAFEQLGGTTQAIEAASQASLGLVKNSDLLAIANKAIVAGLPDINKNFSLIAGAGAQLADTLGTDTKGAIEQLTQALATGRDVQLRMLGINIDSQKANEAYAASIGKVADELTETEKRAATQAAAFERLKELTGELAPVTDSVANAKDRLKNVIQNTIDKIAIEINSNQQLQDSFNALSNEISQIDVTNFINGLNAIIDASIKAIGVAIQLSEALAFLAQTDNARAVQNVNALGTAIDKQFGKGSQKALELFDSLAVLTTQTTVTAEEIDHAKNQIDKFRESLEKTNLSAEEKFKIISELSSVSSDLSKRTIKLDDVEKDLKQTIDEVNNGLGGAGGLNTNLSDHAEVTNEATKQVNKLTEAQKRAAEQNKIVQASFDKINKELKEGESGSLFDQLFSAPKTGTGFEQALAQNISSAISSAISTAFDGGNSEDFKNAASQLGSGIGQALGSQFGPIGAAIGGELGEKLASSTFEVFRATLKGNRADIQKALDDDFIKYGFGVAGLFLNEFASSLIGSKNAQANARQAITNFINDAIKQAREESGFSLADFYIPKGRDGFDAFVNEAGEITTAVTEEFKKLDPAIRQVFDNLAPALQETFALDELGLDQISQIFAINFGGLTNDLNDLQLLFQSMGLSAEETGKMIEDAYLRGDLSAGQFLSSMGQVEDLFTRGIPGAIGATGQALDNFDTSALSSGREGWDSYGDIAAEAIQKGLGNIQDLRADVIASGRDVQKFDAIVAASAAVGINTLQEWQNATLDQSARVIATLENSNYGFIKQTESVQQLRDALDSVTSKKIDIELNVKTNYDSSTQALLNNPATSSAVPQLGGV